MNLLCMFLRRSKRRLVIATLAGVVSGLSTTALVAIVNIMIRRRGESLRSLTVAFSGLCILRLLSGITSHALLVRLSQDAVHDLRMELCQKMVNAPLRQLEMLGASRFMTAFADDMLHVATAVINLPYLFVNAVVLAGCFVYLGWLSWMLLLGIGLCVMMGGFSYLLVTRFANRRLELARQEQESLFDHFRNLVAGLKELKAHAARRSEFMTQRLGRAANGARQHNTAGITIYSAAANWSRLLFFVYVGILLLWPAGDRSTAELAACVIVILYMMAPIEAILNALPVMAQANVALHKVASLESSLGSETIGCVPAARPTPIQWRELALVDVCYTYQDVNKSRQFVLGPINLELRPGEITFLVGGNGSGKTTLGKIIAGLYGPDSGEVHLDGEALTGLGGQECRQMCSVVFNDGCLFDEILGIEPARLRQANRYLRALRLDHKVTIDDGRFSTTQLSQGQRKRLALLVALLEDRPIYLFDEWAADQDPEFKELFYSDIVPDLSRSGKAVVVITHDDRYFDVADRLIKLEDGQATAFTANVDGIQGSAFLKAINKRTRFDVSAI